MPRRFPSNILKYFLPFSKHALVYYLMFTFRDPDAKLPNLVVPKNMQKNNTIRMQTVPGDTPEVHVSIWNMIIAYSSEYTVLTNACCILMVACKKYMYRIHQCKSDRVVC